MRSGHVHVFLHAELLPEEGNCATDLHVRNVEFAWNSHYLLFLHEVTDEAIIIYSSAIEACASSLMHTSTNQRDNKRCIPKFPFLLPEKALDQWSVPSLRYALFSEVFEQVEVPEVARISCDFFERVFTPFLHPINASLPRAS